MKIEFIIVYLGYACEFKYTQIHNIPTPEALFRKKPLSDFIKQQPSSDLQLSRALCSHVITHCFHLSHLHYNWLNLFVRWTYRNVTFLLATFFVTSISRCKHNARMSVLMYRALQMDVAQAFSLTSNILRHENCLSQLM